MIGVMAGAPGVVSSCRHRAILYSKERVRRLIRQMRVAGGILTRGAMVAEDALAAAKPQAVDRAQRGLGERKKSGKGKCNASRPDDPYYELDWL